jgi:hypothetical protein
MNLLVSFSSEAFPQYSSTTYQGEEVTLLVSYLASAFTNQLEFLISFDDWISRQDRAVLFGSNQTTPESPSTGLLLQSSDQARVLEMYVYPVCG